MSELPFGWAKAHLEDVALVVRGITFPASAKRAEFASGFVCCLRTSNVQRRVDWSNVYYVPIDYVKRLDQFVAAGDILMSMANSYELVGKVAPVVETLSRCLRCIYFGNQTHVCMQSTLSLSSAPEQTRFRQRFEMARARPQT